MPTQHLNLLSTGLRLHSQAAQDGGTGGDCKPGAGAPYPFGAVGSLSQADFRPPPPEPFIVDPGDCMGRLTESAQRRRIVLR